MPNPFGIRAGDTPKSDIAHYMVQFHAVPNSHPDMKDYFGTWSPEAGITSVRATSHTFRNDSSGSRAITLYERLKKQLTSVYGSSETVEFIDEDATWNDFDEFARSLLADERCHFTKWTPEAGSRLDANICEITLMIMAEDDESTSVNLMYDFQGNKRGQPGIDVGLSSL